MSQKKILIAASIIGLIIGIYALRFSTIIYFEAYNEKTSMVDDIGYDVDENGIIKVREDWLQPRQIMKSTVPYIVCAVIWLVVFGGILIIGLLTKSLPKQEYNTISNNNKS